MITREIIIGLIIPFIGTSAGAACVFFMKRGLDINVQKALTGFAAGVMVAASVWSLIIPSMEQSNGMGRLAFLPAFAGFWIGILFLLALDNLIPHLIPHLHLNAEHAEGPASHLARTTMMVLAVVLHNIPEGMAVGVVYAGYATGSAEITAAGAMIYVVVEELIPEMAEGEHSHIGLLLFAAGFTVMMALDVALG